MSRKYCVVETECGYVGLAWDNGRLLRSTLPAASRDRAVDAVKAGLEAGAAEDEAAFGDLPGRIGRYFAGERVDFRDVPLDLGGYGPFHSAVLAGAQRIPYGTLTTYGDLARAAGNKKAARAAGTAMAKNVFPIIVPCHRVVASGGRIGGFSSGLEWKRVLLKLEGIEI